MASVLKFILLFLVVLFLITVVRIAFSVLRLLSLPMEKASRRAQLGGEHEEHAGHGRQAPPRTIELDKNDYKVE